MNVLAMLFEHNLWANEALIRTCSALADEQLDAASRVGGEWTIRQTLVHLVAAQRGYLALLTLPAEARRRDPPPFAELLESANVSGAGLIALTRDETSDHLKSRLRTMDGYWVEPWVVMVQSINHATEHRRQIGGMLRALGVNVPALDGWTFAETAGALGPVSE